MLAQGIGDRCVRRIQHCFRIIYIPQVVDKLVERQKEIDQLTETGKEYLVVVLRSECSIVDVIVCGLGMVLWMSWIHVAVLWMINDWMSGINVCNIG